MRRRVCIGMAAAAMVLSWSEGARAEFMLTLDPGKDNSLYQDALGSVSNGAGDYLFVGRTNRGQLRRGAIAFDVSSLPANATVSSVTLTLTLSNDGPAGASALMMHRFLADWGEGTSDAGEPGGTGAPATTGDATWAHAFYDTVPWATPGGDFSPTMSASRTIGGQFIAYDITAPQLAADVQGWLDNPGTNFGWALLGNEAGFGTAKRFNSREHSTTASRPRLTIIYDVLASGSTWNIDGGGAWGVAANWTGGVPDGVGAEARFLDKLSAANAPALVTLGANRTVGKLTFDNADTYEIAAATHVLTIDNGSSPAEINVIDGTHVINTMIRVAGDTKADVRSRLNATAAIMVDAGRSLQKVGDGTLDASLGIQLAPGARLEAHQGTIAAANIRGGALEIDDGRVEINPDGTSAGTSALDDLEFDGQGTFDLSDNDLVLRATAATKQSMLEEVVTRIKTARNAAAGRWKGPGLTSSAAEADDLTTLAVVLNPGLPQFSGQDVGPDDILVKYTWSGDATLDGFIDADDYFRIDSGFANQPADPAYDQGDFNYDGLIDADDYFQIDSAFAGQTGTLGQPLVAATVPEPGLAAAAILGALGLASRRRRRRLCSASAG